MCSISEPTNFPSKKVSKQASATLDGVLFMISKNNEILRTAVFPAITERQPVLPELCANLDYASKVPPRPVQEEPQGFFKIFSSTPTKVDVQAMCTYFLMTFANFFSCYTRP